MKKSIYGPIKGHDKEIMEKDFVNKIQLTLAYLGIPTVGCEVKSSKTGAYISIPYMTRGEFNRFEFFAREATEGDADCHYDDEETRVYC